VFLFVRSKKAEKEKPAQKAVKEFQFDEELASGTVCRTQIINIRK